MVSVGVLRKILQPGAVNSLWQSARVNPVDSNVACPLCRNRMKGAVHLVPDGGSGSVDVDVCTLCPAVWFDTHELETIGRHYARPAEPVPPEMPERAREIMALAEIEMIRRRAEEKEQIEGLPPSSGWQTILTMFGIPVEERPSALSRWPFVTWGTILLMVLGTVWRWHAGSGVADEWGLSPADPGRSGGLTFLTSFFLHAGFLHLFVNAAFLAMFGDDAEDYLGHGKFLLLLLGATLAGDFVHLLLDPRVDMPLVGASGGISGVIAFYALQFPRARLVAMIRFGVIIIHWVRFNAATGFVLWLLLQAVGIYMQMGQLTLVSSLAHVGGALFGVVFWFGFSGAECRRENAAKRVP